MKKVALIFAMILLTLTSFSQNKVKKAFTIDSTDNDNVGWYYHDFTNIKENWTWEIVLPFSGNEGTVYALIQSGPNDSTLANCIFQKEGVYYDTISSTETSGVFRFVDECLPGWYMRVKTNIEGQSGWLTVSH